MAHDDKTRDEMVRLVQFLILEGGKVAGAFASVHGLHHTDVEALLHVMVGQDRGEPMTPGGLGEVLDLTSGAITSVVDRLERAGHVVRVRDGSDRRRVQLQYSAEGRRLGEQFFGPLGARTDAVMDRFTPAELEVARRFLVGVGEAMAAHRRDLSGGSLDAGSGLAHGGSRGA